MSKKRKHDPTERLSITPQDDDHCPLCGSDKIKQVGDIQMECPDCNFCWNDYALVPDEEDDESEMDDG